MQSTKIHNHEKEQFKSEAKQDKKKIQGKKTEFIGRFRRINETQSKKDKK